jgi:hypothetical protein
VGKVGIAGVKKDSRMSHEGVLTAMNDAFERNQVNPNGGWSTSMLAQIDKEIPRIEPQQIAAGPANYDPAPTAEGVAKERMEQLLANITTSTLNELRELRDEIDNLIRTVQARHDTILNACYQHVDYSTSTIMCKEIIKGNLSKIATDFKNGYDPVPKTVTVEKQ